VAESQRHVDTLEVILTRACNLDCGYCYQDHRRAGAMGWSVLRAAMELLLHSDTEVLHLAFGGGEPLLELDLMARSVEYLHARLHSGRGVRLSTSTNGTLMDRDAAAFLSRYDITTQISWDGIGEAQDLRAPGTSSRLERGLEVLREHHSSFLRDRCRASITLTSSNLPYLSSSFEFLLAQGFCEVRVAPVVTDDPGWRKGTIEVLADQVAEIFEYSLDRFKRTGEIPFAHFRVGDGDRTQPSGPPAMCGGATLSGLTVDVNGQVYRCPMLAEPLQRYPAGALNASYERLRLGDLRAPDFAAKMGRFPVAAREEGIFSGKQRKYSNYRGCDGCRFLWQCSVCPASLGRGADATDVDRVPDMHCAFNLVVLAARRRFLSETGTSVTASQAEPRPG